MTDKVLTSGDPVVATIGTERRYGYVSEGGFKNGEPILFLEDYYGNDLGWAYFRQCERMSEDDPRCNLDLARKLAE